MDSLAFISAAAMTAHNIERQSVTNELANVSTIGFKRSFDTAQGALKVAGPGFDSRFLPKIFSQDVIDLSPGSLMATGRSLDIAMNESTVLGVQAQNGDLAFTRRGDLRLSDAGVLETGSGDAVLGEGGDPIVLPLGLKTLVAADGTLYTLDDQAPEADPVEVGRLLLRDASQVDLARREDGLFTPLNPEDATENGDFADGPIPPSVTSEVLEGGNASPVLTLVKLLEMSRAYEMQVKLISQADQLDQSGSSMIRMS